MFREGDISAQSCKARRSGLGEETSDTSVSHWLLLGISIRKKVSEVKSRKAPWSKKSGLMAPEAG